MGEFDKPDPAAVAALARLYLYLGFGAEARAVLKTFAVDLPDAPTLRALAAIMDDERPDLMRPLAGLAACDGAAAMWSALARPAPDAGDPVKVAAVLRTFSALPLHLRRALGPRLSQVFLARGDTDTAGGLRDAITRAPGDPGAAVELLDARLDLARGNLAHAEKVTREVAAEAGPQSPEATVLNVETRIARGAAVDGATIEAVAALAHEHRNTALGHDLARAHLLALASAGDYDTAFAELAVLLPVAGAETAGVAPLWKMLAEKGPDEALLHNGLVPPAETVAPGLRLAIADRLIGLGFDKAAEAWVSDGAGPRADAQLRLARAALGRRDATAALDALTGQQGPVAERLRARAYALSGAHDKAAEAYGRIGAVNRQAQEAWRAADWVLAGEHGTEAQKRALDLAFGRDTPAGHLPPEGAPAAAPPAGPLARGRALVEQSRKARETLDALLKDTGATALASPGR